MKQEQPHKKGKEAEKEIVIGPNKKSQLNDSQLNALIKRVSRDSVRRSFLHKNFW